MSEIKTWAGWAIFDPRGNLWPWGVRDRRKEAVVALVRAAAKTWPELRKRGWRVAKIALTAGEIKPPKGE